MSNRVSNLAIHKKIQMNKVPKAYKKIASGLESQFAKQMLNEMRKSIHKEKPDSTAQNYYNGMLNDKHAEIMTEQNDLGLQEVILRDILPKHILERATHITKRNGIAQYTKQDPQDLERRLVKVEKEISNE